VRERVEALELELKRTKELLKIKNAEAAERGAKYQSQFKQALNALILEHKKELQAKFRDTPAGHATVLELKSMRGKIYTASARSTETCRACGRSEERKSVIDRHKVQIIQLNDEWKEQMASLKSTCAAEIRPLQEKIAVIARELGRLNEQNEEVGMVMPPRETDVESADRYAAPFSLPLLSLVQNNELFT
jgi:hypothetical protein